VLDKINISEIVTDHIKTLKAYHSERQSWSDILIFFFVPAVLAGLLARSREEFSSDFAGLLAAILSVFAALLFNLILLIYDIVSRQEEANGSNEVRHTLLRQIYSNVSFCILVSIFTLLLLLVYSFHFQIPAWAHRALAFSIYYLVGVFLLTLFMVLKRIHVVLRKEVKNVGR
jgi:hypothetical protein